MPKKVEITDLGKFLRKFRAANNMTAAEMAQDLHISQAFLYKIESGERNATFDFYDTFCIVFGGCNKSKFDFDQAEFDAAAGKAINRIEFEVENADETTEWLKIVRKLKWSTDYDLRKVYKFAQKLK